MLLPYVASQYAASDFYPITLCEVRGHAGHSTHNGGCHLWCDILQRFSIAYAYGSQYELFKGFIRTEESEELGSIVNRFSARRLHKSEV